MTIRFELLSQLGKGGMGTVWKARDSETGEIVALKLLHEMYIDDADYVARFEREVDIARRIDSPHVVKVFGYGKLDGIPYVAMEYVEGPSLRERIREGGPMDWMEAKRLGTQMAQALSAAHAAGVIHRDVKPSNVLLDPSGSVKLADFGIARAADLTRMTGSVTVLGTPAYMSPDGEANEQSDLYGLGCVLFEMLTGSPPFVGESQQQVILKHIRETPDIEKLPAEARPVVGWLLEKEAKDRPGSADALVAVLEGSTKGPLPKPVTLTTGPGGRRKRYALVGAVGLLPVMLIGGVGAFLLAPGGDEAEMGGVGTEPTTEAETRTTSRSEATPHTASDVTSTATDTSTWTPEPTVTPIPTPEESVVGDPGSPTPTRTPTATPSNTSTPTLAKMSINTPTTALTATHAATPSPSAVWSQFVGSWYNIDVNTRSFTRFEVSDGGEFPGFRAWGSCHPVECDIPGHMFSFHATNANNQIIVILNSGFATETIIMTLLSSDAMNVQTYTKFTDGSGRSDYTSSDDFDRTYRAYR